MLLLLLLLLSGTALSQDACPPCVVVDPIVPGQPDDLSGVYTFFAEDSECPGGCSFKRDGLIYCMGPGPRTGTESEECPATSPSSSLSSSSSPSTSLFSSTMPAVPSSTPTPSESSKAPSSPGVSTTPGGSTTTNGLTSTTSAIATTTMQSTSSPSPSSTSGPASTSLSLSTGLSSTTSGLTSTAGLSTTAQGSTTAGVSTTSLGSCEEGWSQSGSQCYKLVKTKVNYPTAVDACAAYGEGGLLAAPNTAEVLELLSSTLNSEAVDDFWVGIDDIDEEGVFRFSDGTTFTKTGGEWGADDITWYVSLITQDKHQDKYNAKTKPFIIKTSKEWGADDITWSADFTAWKSGQPKADATSRSNQDCVRVDTNGLWDEMHCTNNVKNYACQIPVGTEVQPVCEDGWAMAENLCFRVSQGFRIRMEFATVDYSTASDACTSLAENGMLAAPKSEAIFTLLTTLNTNAVDFWVGLDDRTTEGTYTFSDGTSFTLTGGTIGTSDATWSTDFTAWKDGQPKDDVAKQEKQDCVKVTGSASTSAWDDVDCTNSMPAYACQKPLA